MVETGVPGLEQTGWDALRGQLNTLDTSLLFLPISVFHPCASAYMLYIR